MIELKQKKLVFRFPEVHPNAVCEIEFERTLRSPDDNFRHRPPVGLGYFPVEHVEDHAERLPESWREHGGVVLPMYPTEAMRINLLCPNQYPFAIKIAAGKINALTGQHWNNTLDQEGQDYLVVSDSDSVDGFCVAEGAVRQFVAMPLGAGYTAEEQMTFASRHGGLQLIAFPLKLSVWQAHERPLRPRFSRVLDIGFAPGGLLDQRILEDTFGHDAWDTSNSSRCFVHILNAEHWREATESGFAKNPLLEVECPASSSCEPAADNRPVLGSNSKLANLESIESLKKTLTTDKVLR